MSQFGLGRLGARVMLRGVTPVATRTTPSVSACWRMFASQAAATTPPKESSEVFVSETRASENLKVGDTPSSEKVLVESCGDVNEDSDDEMEQEEMFVDPHESFEHQGKEWGGPRRGGRLLEPTRFGDWERKGRCTDF